MDGIHDVGGMHGFGRIEREEDEPTFHADWERRVFGYANLVTFVTGHGDDQLRREIEHIPPAEYLESSYYELWHKSVISVLKELGALTEDEIAASHSLRPLPAVFDPSKQAQPSTLWEAVHAGASQSAPGATSFGHRFGIGDRARTKKTMPYDHTRLPRYARGKLCTVIAERGPFIVADRNSEKRDTKPDMLYTVEFEAKELWGDEARPGDTVLIDAWDCYLSPPDEGAPQ